MGLGGVNFCCVWVMPFAVKCAPGRTWRRTMLSKVCVSHSTSSLSTLPAHKNAGPPVGVHGSRLLLTKYLDARPAQFAVHHPADCSAAARFFCVSSTCIARNPALAWWLKRSPVPAVEEGPSVREFGSCRIRLDDRCNGESRRSHKRNPSVNKHFALQPYTTRIPF